MGVTLGTGTALPNDKLSPAEEVLAHIIDDLDARLKNLENPSAPPPAEDS